MKKTRLWTWIIAAAVLALLIVGGNAAYHYFVRMPLAGSTLAQADRALASSITITDPRSDFASMGGGNGKGKPNNLSPYDLGYNDIKSLSLAADDTYLYCKVTFWGVIPDRSLVIGEDRLTGVGIKMNFTDAQGEDQQIWMLGFGWLPILDRPTVNTYYFYGPTGIREPEDKRFSGRGTDSRISGGAGYDYLVGALPLKAIEVKPGGVVHITFQMEVASKVYDHASVDVLGGHGKMPGLITWTLGTQDFSVDDDFYNG